MNLSDLQIPDASDKTRGNPAPGGTARPQPRSILGALKARPWIFIFLFFLAFVAALAATVVIAVRNEPAEVTLEGGADGH